MTKLDQSGFDNQPVEAWLDASAAATLLGVKRATLYAYVSRGRIRSMPGPRGQRGRRYHKGDLARVAARSGARRGHDAVAAGALRWGEPVLDTSIVEITADELRYRGHDATVLARDARFEDVAELLWTGELGSGATWARLPSTSRVRAPAAAMRGGPLLAMSALVPLLAAADPNRLGAGDDAERDRARSLVIALLDAVSEGTRGTSIAERLAPGRSAAARQAINAALVLVADHGLNVSTFAARVAASSGADLYACTSAALAALGGPLHGGACDQIEAMAASLPRPADAGALLRERARLGLLVPGFGHPLYRDGDVRATPLLALARALRSSARGSRPRGDRLLALERAARRAGRDGPTIDFALVTTCAVLGLPPGCATGLFAIGRAAGWIAHIFEQRAAGYLLRPRARFRAPTSAGDATTASLAT